MVRLVLVIKLHCGWCVVQRCEQVLFHISDWAAVLCKAHQHKADMVSVQLHETTTHHLGGFIVPGNAQHLAVGGAGVHQQIHDLIDGVLSPASASFDLYPNFEVRGREFKSIVNALK